MFIMAGDRGGRRRGSPRTFITIADGTKSVYNLPVLPGYTDFDLEVIGRSSAVATTAWFKLQVNSLATSIYSLQRTFTGATTVQGSTTLAASSLGGSSEFNGLAGTSVTVAGAQGLNAFRFYDYAATFGYKQMWFQGRQVDNNSTDAMHMIWGACQIDTTQPINTVNLTMLSGNLTNGSIIKVKMIP